jgi:hypothetical protein
VNLATNYEGHIMLSIHYDPRAASFPQEVAPVLAEVRRLLGQCGDVMAMHTTPPIPARPATRDIIIEFYNSDAAAVAIDLISGTHVHVSLISLDYIAAANLFQGVVLEVALYQPDVRLPAARYEAAVHEQLSATGRSRVPIDDNAARIADAIQRDAARDLPQRGRLFSPGMNHNVVDIARIRAGVDVRTTVSGLSIGFLVCRCTSHEF